MELVLVDLARDKAGGHNSYRSEIFFVAHSLLFSSFPTVVSFNLTDTASGFSCSRSVGARVDATDVSSPKKILAALLLAGTGLALWLNLQGAAQVTVLAFSAGGLSLAASAGGGGAATVIASAKSSTQTEECLLLTESVSGLCVRACEAVLGRTQAATASKEELVTLAVPGALEALLAMQDGLTR